jgi:hypothetical protein
MRRRVELTSAIRVDAVDFGAEPSGGDEIRDAP